MGTQKGDSGELLQNLVPDRGGGEEAFQRRGLHRKRDYWCIYSMLPWMFPDTNKAGKCQLVLEKISIRLSILTST